MFHEWKLATFIFVLSATSCSDAYRILGLFPHPGLSHFKVFYPIMRGMAETGHNVTVVSYFPDPNPVRNYHDFRFEGQNILTNTFSLENFSGRTFMDNFREFFELAAWGRGSCEAALHSAAINEVLHIHRSDPYDLVVMEVFATDCMAGVSWIMQVPFVGLSSCALMPWHYNRVALPDIPSYIPSEFSTFSEKMSIAERFENWLITRTIKLLYKTMENSDNLLLRSKFPDAVIPDVSEIVRNTSLILVNQHYSLSGARPLVPSVIEIGGVHIQALKPLPDKLQSLMDHAHAGVIIVSFGSVLKSATLPIPKRNAMLEAFKQLEQTVVWKWEEEMEDKPENVITQHWLPQRDILCHKNVKLFVTHGGLLSVSEGVHCGVPMVTVPIYGDQFLNSAALVHREAGVCMAYEMLDNVTYVSQRIRAGLNERTWLMAQTLSKAYRQRPQKPLDLAIWSLTNVIENGAKRYERSFGSELAWPIYYSLDVILILLLITSLWVLIMLKGCRKLYYIIRLALNGLCTKNPTSKHKET